MINYREELLELRKKFGQVDTDDPEAIRKWFADHEYLTTNDHALVTGKSRWYVRQLRKRAGLTQAPPKKMPKPHAPRKIVNIDTTNWDTKEWFEKAIQLYTIKQIARAIQRDKKAVKRRVKKWNLKLRPLKERTRPQNPCCTKEWVYNHYVEKGLSQRQCAKLANISPQNFANWLIRFEIQVRHRGQLPAVPIWVRKLVCELEKQDVVRAVYLRPEHVHIRTMHYFWESYYPNRTGKRLAFSYNITRADARLERIPTVAYQYESELDGTNRYPGHIQINQTEWKHASFLERRMALHQFGWRIFENKYVQLTHPTEAIENDLEFVRQIKEAKLIKQGGFTAFPLMGRTDYAPGKKIIEHFFDMSYLWQEALGSPRYITHVLNSMAEKTHTTINTHNMIRSLLGGVENLRHKKIPRIQNPAVYVALLRRLGVRGPVLDLHPGYGSRAIACAILGIPYLYPPNALFEDAVNRGFAEFLGLDCRPYEGGSIPMLLCDNDLDMPNLKEATDFAKSATNMLIFVTNDKRFRFEAKMKPKSIIPIKARYYKKKMDYFFLY